MDNRLITLKQLDRAVEPLREVVPPREGWVRTMRKAIGMTIAQLAKRLGVNSARAVKIETAEVDDAVTIRTLRQAAEAMDCRLVYAFVPNQTLEAMINKKAETVSRKHLSATMHTMALEEQSVESHINDDQLASLKTEMLSRSWKHLWEED